MSEDKVAEVRRSIDGNPSTSTRKLSLTMACQTMLVHKVLPVLDATYGSEGYIWSQDGAPVHTSRAVQWYLEKRLGSSGFWSKVVWPPSSPNLNPLDFSIWGHVEGLACSTSHPNVIELKHSVTKVWGAMSESYVRSACTAFWDRIGHCIESKGGVFKK